MTQDFSQSGTVATGNTYDPVIIENDDYLDIRVALGFEIADDTNVPSDLIERRSYLRFVETRVIEAIPTYATIVDTGDADYNAQRADALKNGVILWTASRLAALWFGARQGSEVTSEGVGPLKVSFRTGPEWQEVAARLAQEAASELAVVTGWGETAPRMTLFGKSGPTRKAYDDAATVGITTWRERLWPPVVKDRDYP